MSTEMSTYRLTTRSRHITATTVIAPSHPTTEAPPSASAPHAPDPVYPPAEQYPPAAYPTDPTLTSQSPPPYPGKAPYPEAIIIVIH